MSRSHAKLTARRILSENVRIARATLGWSQMEFAEECGLDRTYIGIIERATASVGVDVLDKLAVGLGVPVNVLLLPPDQAQPLIYAAVRRTTK